ncbi:hypothetical protein FJY71_07040 [candidate division WOR-3 bacterium]|nr:hypothetical protein [candidate division WOR-3 bacterium]
MRKQHSAFAAASAAVLAVLALASPALAVQENHKPCLCGARITPLAGSARTVYVAQVKYSDPDADIPARVEVYIDDVAYPMRLAKGKPANGIYQARLTLPPGEHTYYFYGEDVRGLSERFPRYGQKRGPNVGTNTVFNRLPVLTNGGVYFDYGPEGTTFTFTVHYQDRDGRRPRAVRVIIDGLVREMSLHEGTATDGIYLYRAQLPVGPHSYYFVGIDDCGACVAHPRHGLLRGPVVDAVPNRPPELIQPLVDPLIGSKSARFSYRVEYRDPDGDPPSIARVYVDGIPHDLKLRSGRAHTGLYGYRMRHYLGDFHEYYFYFEDGRGGVRRLPDTGTFHGPNVVR